MVVILLLAPSEENGCDQSSEGTLIYSNSEGKSTSESTSSTATTAVPAATYYHDLQRNSELRSESKRATEKSGAVHGERKYYRFTNTSPYNFPYTNNSNNNSNCNSSNNTNRQFIKKHPKLLPRRSNFSDGKFVNINNGSCSSSSGRRNIRQFSSAANIANAIPKPPRNKEKNYVRHVTRVNFYDCDSQVEVGEDGDAEAVTKEEEWITKRKTELTTTRQIETRVKRQVVLEDGRVVEDTGPIVSTNTTEDTEKQETESTERRNLGDPDVVDGPESIEHHGIPIGGGDATTVSLQTSGKNLTSEIKSNAGKMVHAIVARPDGLVREINEKRVFSREETDDRLETEDVRHLGDFSDEAYVNAVNSGVENLEEVLYSPEHQKQLVPTGPKVVHQSTKSHKTVDTEDVEKRCLAQPDGTLVTEKKKTTEHEEIFDEDLPDKDDNSAGSREKVNQIESNQRYYKQRDEQNVEFVADGKVIAKEMRYAAETAQMERDGPSEGLNDWDSLSDRIRKARRNQKSLLQQQKEAAMLADRKDALTNRPLDFDREEETRKGETIKWLESHFGSESTSSSRDGSRDDDHIHSTEVEPTKKTYFNVTIKSNQTSSPPLIANGKGLNDTVVGGTKESTLPRKILLGEREPKTKYFQGISNWSERKESAPRHFATKEFRDELKGTLEKNRLRQMATSREDLGYSSKIKEHDYVRKEDILQQKHAKQYNNYASKTSDNLYRKDSREDSDDSKNIKIQKEDLGYLSGSRTDIRQRRAVMRSEDNEPSFTNRSKANGYLKREDSGYVKGSREDIRSSVLREIEDEREKYKNSLIQRDDSAYVSSSTYFTETPRLPKTSQLRTPDSGIRSPSPDVYDPSDTTVSQQKTRPSVPQRKRAIEKKLRQQNGNYSPPSSVPIRQDYRDNIDDDDDEDDDIHNINNNNRRRHHVEPPPDYSPPPRSRSISPTHISGTSHLVGTTNGITKKSHQRTRFASESSSTSHNNENGHHHNNHHSMYYNNRPTVATQTTQTQTTPTKQTTKVSQAIGNSLRKLVGKIRSASAERKFKIKSKSKSRDRSPSPSGVGGRRMTPPVVGDSTYQQYNVIDSHIVGGGHQPNNHTTSSSIPQHQQYQKTHLVHHRQQSPSYPTAVNRESSVVSSSTTTAGGGGLYSAEQQRDHRDRDRDRRGSSDIEMLASPKQRYYLGEDPYGGSIFGKENKYEGVRRPSPSSRQAQYQSRLQRQNGEDREIYVQRHVTSNTLGRYNKNGNRGASTPNLDQPDYRSAQTLPRKLDHRPGTNLSNQQQNHHSSTINVSIVNSVKPVQNTGPAKPARTYKTLSRSKSFNVHGMNGTNDPSPIYIEKLTRNNYTSNGSSNQNGNNQNSNGNGYMYKSNPHLHETGPQLKSPSIVNLISRSQKDLSRIDEDRKYPSYLGERRYSSHHVNAGFNNGINGNGKQNYLNGSSTSYEKRNIFLKGLQDQAPELYKTLHGDEDLVKTNGTGARNGFSNGYRNGGGLIRDREPSSLESRSPIEINKDTASIIRRGSSSTDDYSETYRITSKSEDPKRPSVTNTVQSYSKKTIPAKDGRGFETIHATERKSITTSRYRGEPMSNLKYMEEQRRRGSNGVGGPVVIEVRGNTRK